MVSRQFSGDFRACVVDTQDMKMFFVSLFGCLVVFVNNAHADWQIMVPELAVVDLPPSCFLISREAWVLSASRQTSVKHSLVDHDLFYTRQPMQKGGRFKLIKQILEKEPVTQFEVWKFEVEYIDATTDKLKSMKIYGNTDKWWFGSHRTVGDLGDNFDVKCWIP
jgi:hypothetical protein